jgi:hypothetical protein
VIGLGDYREHERTLRTHIRLVHGVYVEPKLTLDELNECHDTAHADGLTGNDGWTRLAVKHHHDVSRETVPDPVEEWTW